MITNYDDVKQYRNELDGQFYMNPDCEHSFYYLCGGYVQYPAVCYIQKEDFQYIVQFVPIERDIEFDPDEWIVIDDIDEFIWSNRYNIYYSMMPYVDMTSSS